MPFTFSHPAIVLPLIKKYGKYFSATGLIAGSIAPDFESFIKIGGQKMYSHTWIGIFWFDLPLAFALYLLFHVFIKVPLINHLPTLLENRFIKFKAVNWLLDLRTNLLLVIASLLIGISSHLLWDAFTHLNLYNPDSQLSNIKVGKVRLYILLQYSCSIIGLWYVINFIYKMPVSQSYNKSDNKFLYWLYITLIAILMGSYIYSISPKENDIDVLFVIYSCITSLLFALLTVSIFYTIFKRQIRKH